MAGRAVYPQGPVLPLARQTGARQPRHTSHPLEMGREARGQGKETDNRQRDRDREKEKERGSVITQQANSHNPPERGGDRTLEEHRLRNPRNLKKVIEENSICH